MKIIGISAYYHDSAAALIVDGNIIAAAQEERFTRKKHDAAFPEHAIKYCLEEAKCSLDDGHWNAKGQRLAAEETMKELLIQAK